ncbi:MAG: hypothetical protein ACI4I6_09385 [Hominimerdicola sp.]
MLHGYFDLPTFTFFNEKNIWTGSLYSKFNYRITPVKGDESELLVQVWYGTDCYTLVKDFSAEYHEEFSPAGLEKAIEDLTYEFDKYKEIRKTM